MEKSASGRELWLIRHGETEWSRGGQHTSRTDLPLTTEGEQSAVRLRQRLATIEFSRVLCSPALRARETCRLTGLEAAATVDPRLKEWDYGIYEGKTTAEIQKSIPDWSVWHSPIVGGESLAEVGARAEALLEEISEEEGHIVLFAHAHILRIIAACWIGSTPVFARHLSLSTGSISILGYEREVRAILRWSCN